MVAPFAVEPRFERHRAQAVAADRANRVRGTEIAVAVGRKAVAHVIGADDAQLRSAAQVGLGARVDAAIFVRDAVQRVELDVAAIILRTADARIGNIHPVDPVIITLHRQRKAFRRRKAQRRVDRIGVEAVGILVEQRVGQEAVLLTVRGRDTEAEHVARDRPADRARYEPTIVRTGVAAIRARFEDVARLARNDVDRAAQRILAIKRALRTAQHFDAVDVEQRIVEVSGVRLINAVDEQPDAGLHRLHQRHPDAANRDKGAAAAVAVDVEAGRQHCGFAHRVDPASGQRVAIDRGHGDRHVRKCFIALAGGNDDHAIIFGFSGSGRGRVILRKNRRGTQCGGEHERRNSGKSELCHQASPKTAV